MSFFMKEIHKLRDKVRNSRLFKVLENPRTYEEIEKLDEEDKTMFERAGKSCVGIGDKVMDDYNRHVREFGRKFYSLDIMHYGVTYFNKMDRLLDKIDDGCSLDELSDEIAVGIAMVLRGDRTDRISLAERCYTRGQFGGGSVYVKNKGKFVEGDFLLVPDNFCNGSLIEAALMKDFRFINKQPVAEERRTDCRWYCLTKTGSNTYKRLEKQGVYPPRSRRQIIKYALR